jgi:hypothetical protein
MDKPKSANLKTSDVIKLFTNVPPKFVDDFFSLYIIFIILYLGNE